MKDDKYNELLRHRVDKEDEARLKNAAFDETRRRIAEFKSIEGSEFSIEDVEQLFGEDFLGPREVEHVFGARHEAIPDIPFSKEELVRAKELGQQLIYQTDVMDAKDPDTGAQERGIPITLDNLYRYFSKAHDNIKMFSDDFSRYYESYKQQDYFVHEQPRVGWRLTSKDIVPDTRFSQNYTDQTTCLIKYLKKDVFSGTKLPEKYENAIVEFEKELSRARRWDGGNIDVDTLLGLQITHLLRERAVEVMYRLILNYQANQNLALLMDSYTWTTSLHTGRFRTVITISGLAREYAYKKGTFSYGVHLDHQYTGGANCSSSFSRSS